MRRPSRKIAAKLVVFAVRVLVLAAALDLVAAALADAGDNQLSPPVCLDPEDLIEGATLDCDNNGVEDQVEFDRGTAFDSNGNGVLDKCEPIPGDVDDDGKLGINDGRMLSFSVGSVEGVHPHFRFLADLNEDHRVDSKDVAIWGRLWEAATGTSFACSDSSDNDGDGAVDFPDDSGCADVVSDRENPECEDDVDSDGDGATDFPADAGCTAASSEEEG
jgi:hypothetical protein